MTITHLHEFNDGKGVYVEFYNNKNLEGNPDVTGYYDALNFSTFGAYGFADGVNTEDLSIRVTGKYTATFTGEMKYNINTDNGYLLKINGETVEEAAAGGGEHSGRADPQPVQRIHSGCRRRDAGQCAIS